jgi:DNA-binding XRE family transcriptional regulator
LSRLNKGIQRVSLPPRNLKYWSNCSVIGFSAEPIWSDAAKDLAKLFGRSCQEASKTKGLSQEELAERDLASKMISLIERFDRNPSLNVADSIALGFWACLFRCLV